ncbi:MAG: GntR family transcriptional regulator [Chloroflexia bacterium]|nr:GntR family transcriptional regulator [Chloroflexia bacterium]
MLPELTHFSLRLRTTNVLRKAIVEGRLKPGDRIVEDEVSDQLKVSRGPVREALRQLEQEGLVVSFPYRGTEVVGVSQEEVDEILVPIRLTLERFAFRHALPRLTDAELDELADLVAAMRDAAAAADLDRLAEDDVRFHELVISRSGHPHCLQIWKTIEPRVRAHFRRDAPVHPSPPEEHQELLDALRTRDEATVLAVVEQHIWNYYNVKGNGGG